MSPLEDYLKVICPPYQEREGFGVPDVGNVFANTVVRVTADSNIVLGSGVVIAAKWLLTASHLFCGGPSGVKVESPDGRILSVVRKIYWRSPSVDDYDLSSGLPWPDNAGTLSKEKDELVLLELEQAIAEQADVIRCRDATHVDGCSLLIAGAGMDAQGNFGREALLYHVRYAGIRRGEAKTAGAGERLVLTAAAGVGGAIPGKDSSGSPVFSPDLSDGLVRRLAGIFVSIDDGRKGMDSPPQGRPQTAMALKVDDAAWSWIDSVAGTSPSRESGGTEPSPARFALRRRFGCLMMSTFEEMVGRWQLYIACSTAGLLRRSDVIRLESIRGTRILLIENGVHPHEVKATFKVEQEMRGPGGIYWFQARGDHGDLYFFRRSDRANVPKPRRIRVEFFANGSTHPPPSLGNIWPADDLIGIDDKHIDTDYAAGLIPFVQGDQQDDEGEGYEPPN